MISSLSGSGSSSSATSAVSSASEVTEDDGSNSGTLVFLGVAAVAGVAIAAVATPRRKVGVSDHPLKGALNKRIKLFSNLAEHADDPTARPPRRHEGLDYVNADEAIV